MAAARTAEAVLAIARGEVGVVESPAGSNRVKYNTWYYGREVSGSAYPWCMVFVQWCFQQAGALELLPVRTASCGALMRAAQAAGQWVTEDFQPGDVVIYDFSEMKSITEHTGIVESAARFGVTAIEGNTSQMGSQSNGGQVCRKTRANEMIIGAVRPRYEEEDEMDISRLSDQEILQLAGRLQEVMGPQAVSAALAPELAEAVSLGITDGTNPGAFCTRAQAAVMTLRASKKS